MHRDQLLRHAKHDFLNQAEITVFDIRKFDLAQEFLAQAHAGGISMEQKLAFDVVTYLLTQEFLALL